MADARPFGATRDAQYGFSKIFVHDLEAMGRFYEEVFGLVLFNRHQDAMLGRMIDEITYQSTYPGGSSLTLIKYLDSTGPIVDESIQGFTTTNIEALVERAKAAGGSIPEPIRRIDEFKLRVVFVRDPEGHLNEIVQLDAQ
jgi:predicted enzyme related to lactoylglutathione lyase